jgi:hypothetical protein
VANEEVSDGKGRCLAGFYMKIQGDTDAMRAGKRMGS